MTTSPSEFLDVIESLAEPLAESLAQEDNAGHWHHSRTVDRLARAAALLEVAGREVPLPVLKALRLAAEASRPSGII